MSYDIDFVEGFARVKALLRHLEGPDANGDVDVEACLAMAVATREAVTTYPELVADDPNWASFRENLYTCLATLSESPREPAVLGRAADAAGLMKMHMNRMQGAALSRDPVGVRIRYKTR